MCIFIKQNSNYTILQLFIQQNPFYLKFSSVLENVLCLRTQHICLLTQTPIGLTQFYFLSLSWRVPLRQHQEVIWDCLKLAETYSDSKDSWLGIVVAWNEISNSTDQIKAYMYMYLTNSGPCDLKPLHFLTLPCILRPPISETTPIFSRLLSN